MAIFIYYDFLLFWTKFCGFIKEIENNITLIKD